MPDLNTILRHSLAGAAGAAGDAVAVLRADVQAMVVAAVAEAGGVMESKAVVRHLP